MSTTRTLEFTNEELDELQSHIDIIPFRQAYPIYQLLVKKVHQSVKAEELKKLKELKEAEIAKKELDQTLATKTEQDDIS